MLNYVVNIGGNVGIACYGAFYILLGVVLSYIYKNKSNTIMIVGLLIILMTFILDSIIAFFWGATFSGWIGSFLPVYLPQTILTCIGLFFGFVFSRLIFRNSSIA